MNVDSWNVGEHIGIVLLKTWLLLGTRFDDIVEINKRVRIEPKEESARKRNGSTKEEAKAKGERKEVVRFADAFVERQLIREKRH